MSYASHSHTEPEEREAVEAVALAATERAISAAHALKRQRERVANANAVTFSLTLGEAVETYLALQEAIGRVIARLPPAPSEDDGDKERRLECRLERLRGASTKVGGIL